MPGLLVNPSVCASCGRSYPVNGRTVGDEPGHAAEILRDGREREFVGGAGEAAQPKTIHFQDRLEMREEHLDLLTLAT